MFASNDVLFVRWLKKEVRKKWEKLTEDDISRLCGSSEELATALQLRYGYVKRQADIEIYNWVQRPSYENLTQ